jgi:hypothetical protein
MTTQADITLAAFNVGQTINTTLVGQINTLVNAIADQNTINATHKLSPTVIAQITSAAQQITAFGAVIASIAGASAV